MAAPPVPPAPTGTAASDDTIAALVTRRARIRAWWQGKGAWDHADDPDPPIGLALSGGGIRSATFSLGLLQALSKSRRDALARIDVLSTVSGGGYIGCFLRSLFVPTELRGIDREVTVPNAGLVAEQYRFARRALGSGPQEREVPATAANGDRATVRNPVWWLREHSRYLAPTGPSDYVYALAYVARNWAAMVYLFVIACTALGLAVVGIEALLLAALGSDWGADHAVSPLILLAPVMLAFLGAVSIAYWATQDMSVNERNVDTQKAMLKRGVKAILIGTAVSLIAIGGIDAYVLTRTDQGDGDVPARLIAIAGPWLTGLFFGGLALCVAGALIGMRGERRFALDGPLLTAELRLSLTKQLSWISRWLVILGAGVAVDSMSAWLGRLQPGALPLKSAMLLPAAAFLIKKIPDWLGGTGRSGTIGPLLHRFATSIALVVGVLLYGTLAVASIAVVHHVSWGDASWTPHANWPGLLAMSVVTAVLAIISGAAKGFINLSSLHALYASRLTRAYLGASNRERLALTTLTAAAASSRSAPGSSITTGLVGDRPADEARASGHPHPITENHPYDYIQPQVYGETDLPAPIHIINMTLNETIDPTSQIVARDRKGDIFSLEPGGIRIGDALTDWAWLTSKSSDTGERQAESVSLGQWIAISGAAASAAMGRMSNLGYAVAFTFANIRLGYWWWAPTICSNMPGVNGFVGWVAKHFSTFVYLWNEMTCRYSRGYDRKYLTDGGHYENSGALVLIRRRVPLMLVSDNGADPSYAFEDLQVLIRQVRIDLGGETAILEGQERDAFLDTLGVVDRHVFVDPNENPDWKRSMLDPRAPAFVLVLRVTLGAEQLHLLWIKPRLLPDLPADVTGYAALTGSFPQQPTGDQFFDEAQWESYRRLGEASMERLLRACPLLLSAAKPAAGPRQRARARTGGRAA